MMSGARSIIWFEVAPPICTIPDYHIICHGIEKQKKVFDMHDGNMMNTGLD